MSRIFWFVSTVLAILCISATSWIVYDKLTAEDDAAPTIVRLAQGLVEGREIIESVTGRRLVFFQGIRYARAERYERATMSPSWSPEVYQAKRPRLACAQPDFPLPLEQIVEPQLETALAGEDCLFMNIWKPIDEVGERRKRAVMIYIIGGVFMKDNIFMYVLDAQHLAAIGDVVVVMFNYRLGPFGFLNLGRDRVNLGMHDQLLALEFVHQNLAAFDGDATRVLLFGNSAGSTSVGSMIVSAARLHNTMPTFQRVIMQSGTPLLSVESTTKSRAKTITFATYANCTDQQHMLRCLKNKTTEEIIAAFSEYRHQGGANFQIVYGTDFMPDHPLEALRGWAAKRPLQSLLFGVVKDEGLSLAHSLVDKLIEEGRLNYDGVVDTVANFAKSHPLTPKVLQFYTSHLGQNSSKAELRKAVDDAYGDAKMICPMIYFGRSLLSSTNGSVFSYRLDQPLDAYGCHRSEGVCHAVDVHFTFGLPLSYYNSTHPHPTPYGLDDYNLSLVMTKAWTNFANTGRPGRLMDTVPWTEAFARTKVDDDYMRLVPFHYRMSETLAEGRCRVWETILFAKHAE